MSLLLHNLYHLYSNSHKNSNISLSDQCHFYNFMFINLNAKLEFPRGYLKAPRSSEGATHGKGSTPSKFSKGCTWMPSLMSHNDGHKVKGSEKSCSAFFSKYLCAYYVQGIMLDTGDKRAKQMTTFLLRWSLHFSFSGRQQRTPCHTPRKKKLLWNTSFCFSHNTLGEHTLGNFIPNSLLTIFFSLHPYRSW